MSRLSPLQRRVVTRQARRAVKKAVPAKSCEPSEIKLGPALEFLQGLWGLNRSLERLSLRMEKRFGITGQQRLMLRCLGSYPGITAGQLANLLKLDPGTVSATLRRLEQKGLIARRRDPNDSRKVAIRLSRRGAELDAPVEGTVESAVEELLATTPAAQVRATARALQELTELVDRKLPAELQPHLRAKSARV